MNNPQPLPHELARKLERYVFNYNRDNPPLTRERLLVATGAKWPTIRYAAVGGAVSDTVRAALVTWLEAQP